MYTLSRAGSLPPPVGRRPALPQRPQLQVLCLANTRRSRPLFDRNRERQQLASLLSSEPTGITVILGPRSAGKTALIQDYLDSHGNENIVYINCRADDVQTPSDFASALLRNTLPNVPLTTKVYKGFLALVGVVAGIKVKSGEVQEINLKGVDVLKAVLDAAAATPGSPMAKILAAYQSALSKPGTSLIIDEFNMLTSWGEEYHREMKTLLSFLVIVSKEMATTQVILATSDYASQAWLEQKIGDVFFTTRVIGDFESHVAREFFDSLRAKFGGKIDDKSWQQIEKVCGGNAGLLRRCALLPFSGSWESVLETVYAPILPAVSAGLQPGRDAGFSAEQYSTAVSAVLNSDHKAVRAAMLVQQLGRSGQAALQAMIRANLLAYRPYSDWAVDIPKVAFLNPTSNAVEPVVTAPSPVHLFCMQKLQLLPSAQEVVKTAAQPSILSEHLLQLAKAIERVEDEIDSVVEEAASADAQLEKVVNEDPKEGNWEQRFEMLNKRVDKLTHKEEQLRKKEEQLMLLLLKQS